VELFLKADITRANAGRKTLHVGDVKFAKYVTDDMHLLADAKKHVEKQLVPPEEISPNLVPF
jgi:aspartate carbamoyltransferase catalytic subunit